LAQICLSCFGCCCLIIALSFIIGSIAFNASIPTFDYSDYEAQTIDLTWNAASSVSGSISNSAPYNLTIYTDDLPEGSLGKVRMCISHSTQNATGDAQAVIPYSELETESVFDIPMCSTSNSARFEDGVALCSPAEVYVQIQSDVPQSFTLELYFNGCNTDVEYCVCDYAVYYLFLLFVILFSVGLTIAIVCCACCYSAVCLGACGVITCLDETSRARRRHEVVPLL
jgi:hypothetical protein